MQKKNEFLILFNQFIYLLSKEITNSSNSSPNHCNCEHTNSGQTNMD